MDTEDLIIRVYCLVDDALKEILGNRRVRNRGPDATLTDAEALTMEIVGEHLGLDADAVIYRYFANNWQHLFPYIPDRSALVRQFTNLWYWKQRVQGYLVRKLGANEDEVFVIDGFPMPVAHFKRAHFSRVFSGQAAYGYCAAKSEKYYGFKGHLLITKDGVIIGLTFAVANIDRIFRA